MPYRVDLSCAAGPLRALLGTVALLGGAASAADASGSFTIVQQIETLDSNTATNVSPDGTIVTGAHFGPSVSVWRWTGGTLDLIAFSDIAAAASGATDAGVVVGGTGEYGAFHHVSGPVQLLGFDFAHDISADGSTIVGEDAGLAVYLSGGALTSLGDLPGGAAASVAHGVSDDGAVIVGQGNSAEGGEAFRWEGGTMEGLGDYAGGAFASAALDVSQDGAIAVGYGTDPLGRQAIRWQDDGIVALGRIGREESSAAAVSESGDRIVGNAWDSGPSSRDPVAFVWDPVRGTRALHHVLADAGVDTTGLTLYTANGISADGTTIVGSGRSEVCCDPPMNIAWRATLPPPPSGSVFASPIGLFVVAPTHVFDEGPGLLGPNAGLGDPNSPDGSGAVEQLFAIAPFEVTNAEYVEFLNAVAADDPNGLWAPDMALTLLEGGILRTGIPGSFEYATLQGRGQMPVNHVSLEDALRFANWMQNGKPSGAQDATTTEDGSYDLTSGPPYSRRGSANWAIPSRDEWHKAAYFDPVDEDFRLYPTYSDTAPACDTPSEQPNRANCGGVQGGLTEVGSYPGSSGPHATFDQGGNVAEWIDSVFEVEGQLVQGGFRGGSYADGPDAQGSDWAPLGDPTAQASTIGFRIVYVPEPGRVLLLAAGALLLFVLCAQPRSRASCGVADGQ